MKITTMLAILAVVFSQAMIILPAKAADPECVILLHGLARTASSMAPMADALRERGYTVVNLDYPSRKHPVEVLAPMAMEQGLSKCPGNSKVHFVTHSLGGILVRYYLAAHTLVRLGRVVMLAPPNQGSEVVDGLGGVPGFSLLNGPAGAQLGVGEHSIPRALGAVDFDLGVIAGDRSVNLILSQYLPNPDDGKVSVASTKVEGMRDFIQVPHSHPFIMRAPLVIEQTVRFLETGKFAHAE